jgi:hypothetical protein
VQSRPGAGSHARGEGGRVELVIRDQDQRALDRDRRLAPASRRTERRK